MEISIAEKLANEATQRAKIEISKCVDVMTNDEKKAAAQNRARVSGSKPDFRLLIEEETEESKLRNRQLDRILKLEEKMEAKEQEKKDKVETKVEVKEKKVKEPKKSACDGYKEGDTGKDEKGEFKIVKHKAYTLHTTSGKEVNVPEHLEKFYLKDKPAMVKKETPKVEVKSEPAPVKQVTPATSVKPVAKK